MHIKFEYYDSAITNKSNALPNATCVVSEEVKILLMSKDKMEIHSANTRNTSNIDKARYNKEHQHMFRANLIEIFET